MSDNFPIMMQFPKELNDKKLMFNKITSDSKYPNKSIGVLCMSYPVLNKDTIIVTFAYHYLSKKRMVLDFDSVVSFYYKYSPQFGEWLFNKAIDRKGARIID